MRGILAIALAVFLGGAAVQAHAQSEKIIIDTDIGDDIDDAFAVVLALTSPQFDVQGFSTAFGDTATRARMLDRMLSELGRRDIPIAQGIASDINHNGFSQRSYAEGGSFAARTYHESIDFVLAKAHRYPGQITLVAIGPLTNIGAMIDKDPAGFRLLKRVVIMGGSIQALQDPYGLAPPIAPHPEWNIKNDVASAQKLFSIGVPLFVMPLDATANLKLNDVARTALFSHGSMATNILAGLYYEWRASTHSTTPILYDPMTLVYLLAPTLCPTTPMHIIIDNDGNTKKAPGAPNANVCLHSDPDSFLRFYIKSVAGR